MISEGIFINGEKITFNPENILNGDVSAYTEAIGEATQDWLDEHLEPGGSVPIDDTLTIAGAAADAKKTGDEITELKEDLSYRIEAIENKITVTSSGETKLYLNAGETVTVNVVSITGGVNMYISGYSSTNVKLLNKIGLVKYTAANSGYLRFYYVETATMTAHVVLDTTVNDAVTDLLAKTNGLAYSGTLPLEFGDFDSGTGAKITNANRLRTTDFISPAVLTMTFNSGYYCYVYAYTHDGVYVGSYTGSGWSTNWANKVRLSSPLSMDIFSSYNYVYTFTFIKTNGTAPTVNELALTVLFSNVKNLIINGEETYTVGDGGDFTTFTDMLIGLADNTNKKTVYVYGGEYDIFEEMGGADYMASLTDASSLNWRDVCHVVPPNTTIIGKGDVILSWNPTDAEIIDQSHAFLFSPLNVSGSCTIKNIKIHSSNCRYGIHDEGSGRSIYDGIVHEFENVEVIFTASTYGVKYAYGAGHNKNSKFVFKNCLFSANFADSWSSHDWPTSDPHENSEFSFENCVFINNINNSNGGIRFETADASGRLDNVKIVACVFGRITFGSGTANSKQGYDVTTMLCKPYSILYSTNIADADKIAPKDYLILS